MRKQRCSPKADQHLCFHYTDSTIPLLPKSEISSLQPSSVVVQPSLCRTRSETLKTRFLASRLIWWCLLSVEPDEIYSIFFVFQDDQGNMYMNLACQDKEIDDLSAVLCYVPQCCIMISKYPYFTRVKECLSR